MSGEAIGNKCPALSIVIPAYNEAENVAELYDELTAALDKTGRTYEIIFIDDGSTDDTFSRLRALCERSKSLKAIRLRRNSGQSAALSAGFDHASGDLIVTLDADFQNDPKDIPLLLQKLSDGHDVVCGWRANRKDSIGKKFFSAISNMIRHLLIGDKIHDYGCTFRVYKSECIDDFELWGEMHRYIPALMSINGYRVGEVKVHHRERRHGTSKYNWKRLFKGFTDLLAVTFWSRFATRPMHIFGTTGLIIAALGSLISAYFIVGRLGFGIPLADKPLFVLAVLSIIIGLQFIAFGILADISLKTYYHQKRFKNYRIDRTIGFDRENS